MVKVYEMHLISDGKKSAVEFAGIVGQIHPFFTAIHLREKTWSAAELWHGIDLLASAGVPLHKVYVNDRVDVAVVTGTGGVQLAYHSLEPRWVKTKFPHLRLGRSVHTVQEAAEMEQQGADFLLFGHIFTSGSKPGLAPRGLEALSQVSRHVNVPVIAIGGITPSRADSALASGAAGIAVMSGVLDAPDASLAARQYFEALHGGGKMNGKVL